MLLVVIGLFSPVYAKTIVFTSILPQKYFLKKLGKDFWQVEVMVSKGEDPHTYEPKPALLQKMVQASFYFSLDLPFEEIWLKRFQNLNPNLKIINCARGINKVSMKDTTLSLIEDNIAPGPHLKEQENHHRHDFLDPHIWLSPKKVLKIIENIYLFCIHTWPEEKDFFSTNYLELKKEVLTVDSTLSNYFENCKQKSFLTFHPSWGYLAKDYHLQQISLEVEGRKPSAKELARLIKKIKQLDLKTIFIQPQFSPREVSFLQQSLGLKVEKINPLEENWTQNLLEVGQKLKEEMCP